MSVHLLDLPVDKTKRLDLVNFCNQLAKVADGVIVVPSLHIFTMDDTLDILLYRLGARRLPEPETFPASETASSAAILESDSPACANCGRQVRLNKHGLCMKCQRAKNRNGDGGAAAAKLADEILQDDGSDEPAAEVAKAALSIAAAIQADVDQITGQKTRPADTRTDARFSQPTVFVEDREQNQRILTRYQQPIRGHKLG